MTIRLVEDSLAEFVRHLGSRTFGEDDFDLPYWQLCAIDNGALWTIGFAVESGQLKWLIADAGRRELGYIELREVGSLPKRVRTADGQPLVKLERPFPWQRGAWNWTRRGTISRTGAPIELAPSRGHANWEGTRFLQLRKPKQWELRGVIEDAETRILMLSYAIVYHQWVQHRQLDE